MTVVYFLYSLFGLYLCTWLLNILSKFCYKNTSNHDLIECKISDELDSGKEREWEGGREIEKEREEEIERERGRRRVFDSWNLFVLRLDSVFSPLFVNIFVIIFFFLFISLWYLLWSFYSFCLFFYLTDIFIFSYLSLLSIL